MEIAALVPANVSVSRRTAQPLSAAVTGGATASNVFALISNEEFKQALESSLVKSGMFTNNREGGYRLDVAIVSVEQPLVGISMRVNMEVNYILSRGNSTKWRRNIKSSYSAPIGEALVGAVRVRKATQGAVRENISSLVHALESGQL